MSPFFGPFWSSSDSTRSPAHIKKRLPESTAANLSPQDAKRSARSEENHGCTSPKEEHQGSQTSTGNQHNTQDQTVEPQILRLNQEMMLVSERSRRETEIHLEEMARKDEIIAGLQSDHELLLRQVKSFKPTFEPMDDATCEMTINEIFRSLQVWCFSHFAERTQRSEIRSIISRYICRLVASLSLLSLDASETSKFSNQLEMEIMRTSDASQAHIWRVSTLRADAQVINNEEIISRCTNNMNDWFASIANPAKERTRKPALRKIFEKSMAFRTRLHEQEAKYYLDWIPPGSQFIDEQMVVDTQDRLESTREEIKYCFRPLVRKVVRMPFRGFEVDSIVVVSASVSF